MHDTDCPYCDAEIEIDHDDGYGYDEGIRHEQQCGSCEKYFVFKTSISFHYETSKADCLNDKPHEFKQTHTHPIICTKMECIHCEKRRDPTKKEWTEILK